MSAVAKNAEAAVRSPAAEREAEAAAAPVLGVVLVSYNSADDLPICLATLFASDYPALRVVVVDNDSPDDADARVGAWARGEADIAAPSDLAFPAWGARPTRFEEKTLGPDGEVPAAEAPLTLLRSRENRGFAGGVNLGLRALMADSGVDLFWVLNPDSLVEPQTPAALVRRAREMGRFALIGLRIVFTDNPRIIQSDIGRIPLWLGRAETINLGSPLDATPPPAMERADYIPGASMLASRAFLEEAGLMDESWFLYFEEIDWALRRGDLPLGFTSEARLRHHSGGSIGSPQHRTVGSSLSAYFMFRNQLRFVARWRPIGLPIAYLFALVMIMRRFVLRGAPAQTLAALRGLHGLPPPRAVRARLSEAAWRRALSSGT